MAGVAAQLGQPIGLVEGRGTFAKREYLSGYTHLNWFSARSYSV